MPFTQRSHACEFVTGSKKDYFTYHPGKIDYIVHVREGNYCPHTILIHADSVNHCKAILRKIVKFYGACREEYSNNTGHDLVDIRHNRIDLLKRLLDEDNLDIQELNRTHVIALSPYQEL